MVWKYVETDDYDLPKLYHFEAFFKDDVRRAQAAKRAIQAICDKHELHGEEVMLERAQKGIDEAKKNLEICQEAIRVRTEKFTIPIKEIKPKEKPKEE